MKRAIVIGAGPMGLEAALALAERGVDTTVLERDGIGASLSSWGPTRLYTPFSMNVSARAKQVLGTAAPQDDALLTGPEMVERVLRPLASCAALTGRVRTQHRVISIARARLARTELVGHPLRAERAFRLLVEAHGEERTLEADWVFDATGVFDLPTGIAAGGMPAIGERMNAPRFIRHLGALHDALASLGGKRILLIGHGHSAAHAAIVLEGLAKEARGTTITWATRSRSARPIVEIAGDPLLERTRVAGAANAIAERPPAHFTIERNAHVERIERGGAQGWIATLSGDRLVRVDKIVALTGYRPDTSITTELAISHGPATEGGARLEQAVSAISDCLSTPPVTVQDLATAEPGFFFIGARSYGRARTFLLNTGIQQLEILLGAL